MGLRLGMFDMVNSPDTYDTIYSDPMVQLGVQFEYYPKPWWFLGVSLDHGSVNGEQVALIPEPFPTGVETELTLTPLQLRIGRVVRSRRSWTFPFAVGLTVMRWEESNRFESNSETDFGIHVAAAVRRKFAYGSVGVELRYSTIPNALGDGGAAAFFGEHDLGGLAACVMIGYAF